MLFFEISKKKVITMIKKIIISFFFISIELSCTNSNQKQEQNINTIEKHIEQRNDTVNTNFIKSFLKMMQSDDDATYREEVYFMGPWGEWSESIENLTIRHVLNNESVRKLIALNKNKSIDNSYSLFLKCLKEKFKKEFKVLKNHDIIYMATYLESNIYKVQSNEEIMYFIVNNVSKEPIYINDIQDRFCISIFEKTLGEKPKCFWESVDSSDIPIVFQLFSKYKK